MALRLLRNSLFLLWPKSLPLGMKNSLLLPSCPETPCLELVRCQNIGCLLEHKLGRQNVSGHTWSRKLKDLTQEARSTDQPVRCLPQEQKNLNLILKTHIKESGCSGTHWLPQFWDIQTGNSLGFTRGPAWLSWPVPNHEKPSLKKKPR